MYRGIYKHAIRVELTQRINAEIRITTTVNNQDISAKCYFERADVHWVSIERKGKQKK